MHAAGARCLVVARQMRQRQQSKYDEAAAAAAGDRMGKQHADAQANDPHRHLLQLQHHRSASETSLADCIHTSEMQNQTLTMCRGLTCESSLAAMSPKLPLSALEQGLLARNCCIGSSA